MSMKVGEVCYVIASSTNHVMPVIITPQNYNQIKMYWNVIYFSTEKLALTHSGETMGEHGCQFYS